MERQSYLRLLSYVKPYKIKLIVAIVCSILYGGFNTAPAKFAQPLIDDIFQSHNTRMLKLLPLFIIAAYVGKGIFQYIQTFYLRMIGQNIILDLRNELFEKTLQLPLSFFQKNSSGVLMSRITNDVGQVQNGISQGFSALLKNVFSIMFLTVNIFLISYKLSFFAIIIVPVSLYPLIRFAKKLRVSSRISQEKMGDLNSTMHETFYGINIIKAFNMEGVQRTKFHHFNRDFYHAMIRAIRLDSVAPPLLEFIGALGAAAFVWLGGTLVISGALSAGVFMEFITSLFLLYSPIKAISRLNFSIQNAMAASVRIFEILDLPSGGDHVSGTIPFTALSQTITYEQVYFKYEDKYVLENLTFTAQRGQIIAVVGSSGAGKSTLVNLLPRFFDVTAGRIAFDGTDVRDYDIKTLRDSIGIVTQDTILFNDTVRSNITCGKTTYTEEDIVRAAQAAYAHDFIIELPDRYDTIIGERGISLSGGQRQRITIARAILKNPPILILDEATSSLDSESEAIIQKALNNLMQSRTTFVIAHRLSTVREADFIVVIRDGRIVECGDHEELLALGGEYRRLHDIQFCTDDLLYEQLLQAPRKEPAPPEHLTDIEPDEVT